MKREEAIARLKANRNMFVFEETKQALDMAIEALQTDMISRAELFNRLAVVKAPAEANEYKAEVYRIINEIGGHHDQL